VSKFELMNSLLEKNKGIIITSDAISAGISKAYFGEFVKKTKLKKMAQGLYLSEDAWTDGLYLLQARCPQPIFSHETALYLLGLTDREPLQFTVTAKAGYHSQSLSKQGVKIYTIKKDLYDLGLSDSTSPAGHELKVYNAERTICDIIRSRSNIEFQDMQTALKAYASSKSKNIPQLMHYAKDFRIENTLRQYLEVLL